MSYTTLVCSAAEADNVLLIEEIDCSKITFGDWKNINNKGDMANVKYKGVERPLTVEIGPFKPGFKGMSAMAEKADSQEDDKSNDFTIAIIFDNEDDPELVKIHNFAKNLQNAYVQWLKQQVINKTIPMEVLDKIQDEETFAKIETMDDKKFLKMIGAGTFIKTEKKKIDAQTKKSSMVPVTPYIQLKVKCNKTTKMPILELYLDDPNEEEPALIYFHSAKKEENDVDEEERRKRGITLPPATELLTSKDTATAVWIFRGLFSNKLGIHPSGVVPRAKKSAVVKMAGKRFRTKLQSVQVEPDINNAFDLDDPHPSKKRRISAEGTDDGNVKPSETEEQVSPRSESEKTETDNTEPTKSEDVAVVMTKTIVSTDRTPNLEKESEEILPTLEKKPTEDVAVAVLAAQ
jgi:hypothetical protein